MRNAPTNPYSACSKCERHKPCACIRQLKSIRFLLAVLTIVITTATSDAAHNDDTLISMRELQTSSLALASSLRAKAPTITSVPSTESLTQRDLQRVCNSLSTDLPDVAGAFGLMFNVRAKQSTLQITGLEFYTNLNAAHGRVAYILYSKTGSFVNAQDDLSRWTRETSGIVTGNGVGEATPIPSEFDLTVSEGTTRAIYITLVTSDIRYEYGKVPTPDQVVVQENEDIELREGIATLAWPLSPGNYTRTSRRFLGTIHYKKDLRGCSNVFNLESSQNRKMTTLVEYKFQIAHFNRIGRAQFVDVTNDEVDGYIRSAMNNGMQLRPLVQEHNIELQDVTSYYLRAADNARNCIVSDSRSICSIVSTFLKLTHDSSISSIDARRKFQDYAEDITDTLTFTGDTIGPVGFITDLIFLRLEGVTRIMNNDEIGCFQQVLKRHIFPKLSDHLVTTVEVKVTDQELISNTRKLGGTTGGLGHRHRQLQGGGEIAFHEVSFDVKGEFLPPLAADIEEVLNTAISEDGYLLLEAFQANEGTCEYFRDVTAIPGVNTTKPAEPVVPVQIEPTENESTPDSDSASVDESIDLEDALDGTSDASKAGIAVGVVLFFIVICVILGYFLSDREIREEYSGEALKEKHRNIRKIISKTRKSFLRRPQRHDGIWNESERADAVTSKRSSSRPGGGHHPTICDSDADDEHPSKQRRIRLRQNSNEKSSDESTEIYDPHREHILERSKSDSIVDRKNHSMSQSRSNRGRRYHVTRDGSDPKMNVMEGRSSHARLERFVDETDGPGPSRNHKYSSHDKRSNLDSSDGNDRRKRRRDSMSRSNSSRRHLSKEGSDPKLDVMQGRSSRAQLEGQKNDTRHRRDSSDKGHGSDAYHGSHNFQRHSMRRSKQTMPTKGSPNRDVSHGERMSKSHSMRGSNLRFSRGEDDTPTSDTNMGRSSHARLEQNRRDRVDHQRMSKSHSMRASRRPSLDSSMSKRGSASRSKEREPLQRRGSHSSLNRSASRHGSASSELEERNLNGSASRRGSASSELGEEQLNRSASRRGSASFDMEEKKLNRSASRRGSASSELGGEQLNRSASRRGSASSDTEEKKLNRSGSRRGSASSDTEEKKLNRSASRRGSASSDTEEKKLNRSASRRGSASSDTEEKKLNRSASRRGSASFDTEEKKLNRSASRRGSASSDTEEKKLNRSVSRRGSDRPSNWMDIDPLI